MNLTLLIKKKNPTTTPKSSKQIEIQNSYYKSPPHIIKPAKPPNYKQIRNTIHNARPAYTHTHTHLNHKPQKCTLYCINKAN